MIEVNIQPGPQLGRAGRTTPRRSTRKPGSRGWAPRSSCSTAGTPAPAAATTSSSAARRRPTARSCAGPICCAAWSPTGTTIRRCRICSPACSSGPTSQAPRVDEARNDSLYELEIAFQQIPGRRRLLALAGRSRLPPPAGRCHRQHAPGRVLHRQALFAGQRRRPPGPGRAARLRDAAARPHEPGAAAAAAGPDRPLLEAAVSRSSWCAGAPSCTTASCCRTSSSRISSDVLDETAAGRLSALRSDWFAPHFEFRFPLLGSVTHRGVHLELRQAIEPWHVLGEEHGAGRHGPLRRFVGRAVAGQGAAA